MKGKIILVTGGMGYVGARLVPHLLSQGHFVKVIDLCLYGDYGLEAMQKDARWPEWKSHFTLLREDIRNPDSVFKAVQEVDTIIHLAAISNDPTGEIDDTLTRQVNYDAIGLLISAAKASGVKRFINASSSSVFGIKNDVNVTEELEPEPLTSYSKYKMLSEWIVRAAASKDFCTVSIRPATVCGYSPRQRFDLTVNKLTADAVRKGVITVHGGQQRRPNVGMTDMINIYSQLVDAEASIINGQTFNFGFENHKVIDIANLIKNELKDLPVDIQVTDTFDNRDYHISSAKIIKILGYQPVSSIAMEVAELRKRLTEGKEFADIDASQHYNMKVMKLERNNSAYQFLGRGR